MDKRREVDLHMHSEFSDGHDSPEEVVDRLCAAGIKMAALTDHDTLKGVERFIRHGNRRGISVISGVEVSTIYQGKYDVHIIGLNVNNNFSWAEDLFAGNNAARIAYTEQYIKKLNELGLLDATFAELSLFYSYPGYCVTLLHAMDYMVFKEGRDFQTARAAVFNEKAMGVHRDFSLMMNVQQGINAVHELHGIAILAHPGEFENQIEGDAADKRTALIGLLSELKDAGIKGIEAYHSKHSSEKEDEFVLLAKSMGLHVTSGSDYHGRHRIDQNVGRHGINVLDVLNLFR